jgi:cupin fold WbuC family metalloprotein
MPTKIRFAARGISPDPLMGKVQVISAELIDGLLEKARQALRLRTNHNFHRSLEENPNRFLNVMVKGSYFTPHRHANPPKSEAFLVLQGRVLCIIFDHQGNIESVTLLGDGGAYGIDVGAGVWHTIAVLSDTAVCYEVKPGPYAAATDKDFAAWAPKEGEPGCAEYAASLLERAMAKLP